MNGTETPQERAAGQLHANYLAVRKAYKDAERKFNAMVAGFNDLPPALNTRLDYIEVASDGTLAVNRPAADPSRVQAPRKQIITREQWGRIDEYIAALSDLKQKLGEAQRVYDSLPELDRRVGSKYRSPLES